MTINGIKIYWRSEDDLPGSCGSCPFFFNGDTGSPLGIHSEKGMCMLQGKNKKSYNYVEKGCMRLFKKALQYGEDENLVIVLKD